MRRCGARAQRIIEEGCPAVGPGRGAARFACVRTPRQDGCSTRIRDPLAALERCYENARTAQTPPRARPRRRHPPLDDAVRAAQRHSASGRPTPAPGSPRARATPRPGPRGGGHQVRVEQRARQRRAELHALDAHRAVDAVAPLVGVVGAGVHHADRRPGAGAGRPATATAAPAWTASGWRTCSRKARATRRLSGSVRSRCVSSTYVRTCPVGADSSPDRRLQAGGQVERPAIDAGGEHHQVDGAPGGVVGHRVALAVGARARRARRPRRSATASPRPCAARRTCAGRCSRRCACRRRPATTARASRPAGCRPRPSPGFARPPWR